MSSLRDIAPLAPLYAVPADDLVGEALIPALSASRSVSCMAAFFSSTAFRHVAPGVAAFVNRSSGTFRLLISPVLDDDDREALRLALDQPTEVLTRAATTILRRGELTESALERHTLQCLSYLLAANRLSLRFVLMTVGGIFHPKVWIFDDGSDVLVAHGSSNVTTAGLLFNFETVSIERPWASDEAHQRSERFETLFKRLWDGTDPDTVTIDLPEGLQLTERAPMSPPTLEDFWAAWRADADRGLAPALPATATARAVHVPELTLEELRIPQSLEWESGPFAHQADAVHAWERAGHRGILSMATGSGKTVTALVCAARLQQTTAPMLVVVSAPFRPLVQQWTREVSDFGIVPLPLLDISGKERDAMLREAIRRLEHGVSKVEVAVITHDYLVTDGLYDALREVPDDVASLLIADEVHNLGRPRFVSRPPEHFQYRLGLSATPILQYNQAGTAAIQDFFGETVFEFGLADAIGVCLVPYNYYLHPVPMSPDELSSWEELTGRLMRAGFTVADDAEDNELSPEVVALLVRRRAVVEAAASKVDMLARLLQDEGIDYVRHTLVYCSDKRPEQLLAVNKRLLELGLFVRQLTVEESSDPRRTAEILEDFGRGDYQVVTCKRVLDEGVDIPQVQQAFLLASTTVRRQWVQRLGRILRRCDAIDKRIAHLHDFIVVPQDPTTASGRAILRQELNRVRALAELAANAGSPDGPFATMSALTD